MKIIAIFIIATLAIAGCRDNGIKHETPSSTQLAEPTTPAMSKQQMIEQGNAMMARGQKMRDDASKMSNGEMSNGLSKQDLMIKADKMIADGNAMKERAAALSQ